MISVFFGALGKVLGYGRTLIIVWLFGASGGVDAFYVSLGIVNLFVTTATTVLSSTLLPLMIGSPTETSRAFFVKTWRIFIVGTAIVLAFISLAPHKVALFFARNLDPQRLDYTAQMLLLMFPWVLAMVQQSFLNVWGSYLGRYNVVNSLLSTWNVLAIFFIWGLSKVWGVFAIAQAYSLSVFIVTCLMWLVLRDMPVSAGKVMIEKSVTKGFYRDSLICLGIVGASSLFQVVDRYFGSSLPAGGIAALSFSSVIYTLPVQVLAPAFLIYLVKASEKIKQSEGKEQLKVVLCLAWVYLFPLGCMLAVLAPQVVVFLFGRGAFNATAVDLTARCVAMAAPIIPFAAWQVILFRYAQVQHQLVLIMLISYAGVLCNGVLDWFFLPFWGAPGLCLATSLVWAAMSFSYLALLVPRLILPVARTLSWCTVTILVGVLGLYLVCSQVSILISFFVSGISVVAYYLVGDYYKLFNFLPQQWRPLQFLQYMFRLK